MPQCPQCNNEVSPEASFCGKCGWCITAPSIPKTSVLALISLVLGLLGLNPFCSFIGLPAIILGIMALMKIKRNPDALRGKAFAIYGTILGCLAIVLLLVVMIPVNRKSIILMNLSRAHNDMRSVSVALESYQIDNGAWPSDLNKLTSPVGFIPDIPIDGFLPSGKIKYFHRGGSADEAGFFIWIAGPDGKIDLTTDALQSISSDWTKNSHLLYERTYDATNGTFSAGDIWRANEDSPATR